MNESDDQGPVQPDDDVAPDIGAPETDAEWLDQMLTEAPHPYKAGQTTHSWLLAGRAADQLLPRAQRYLAGGGSLSESQLHILSGYLGATRQGLAAGLEEGDLRGRAAEIARRRIFELETLKDYIEHPSQGTDSDPTVEL